MSHYLSTGFCLSLRNEFSPPNTANLPADKFIRWCFYGLGANFDRASLRGLVH
jgi:hypothetical protein